MTTAIKHRFLLTAGWSYVKAHRLLAVVRNEQVVRYCPPGFHWVNPWHEYALPPIYTGFRSLKFRLTGRSADGIEVKIELSVGFLFDPRWAHKLFEAQMAMGVAESDDALRGLLKQSVFQIVKAAIGARPIRQLCSGAFWPRIEGAIRNQLSHNLRKYGVRLAEPPEDIGEEYPGNESVVLHSITPPPSFDMVTELINVRNMMVECFDTSAPLLEEWLLRTKTLETINSGRGNSVYVMSGNELGLSSSMQLPQEKRDLQALLGSVNGQTTHPSHRSANGSGKQQSPTNHNLPTTVNKS